MWPTTSIKADAKSGAFTPILQHATLAVSQPRISQDGRWVAFVKDEGVWVAPFRGKERVPENEWVRVAEHSERPFWSANGRNLYYVHADDNAADGVQFMRQPFDREAGKLAGPAVAFYAIERQRLEDVSVNQITGAPGGIFVVLMDASSDVWVMDLPQ